MAIFGKNKNTKKGATAKEVSVAKVAAAPKKATPVAESMGNFGNELGHVLRNPRITEKATNVQGMNVYTFDVSRTATKRQIIQAVHALYRVTPRKVAVVPVPQKTRRNARTGKMGISAGGKKAYIYLKAGETITVH